MRTLILRLLAVFMLALALSSCLKEHIKNGTPNYGDDYPVQFTLNIPVSGPSSRAMSVADENEIGTIDVWAFYKSGSDYRFGYRADSVDTELIQNLPNPSGKQIRVIVEAKAYASQQRFVVLANARNEIAAAYPALGYPPAGQKLDDVMAKIISTERKGEWLTSSADVNYPLIPMYAKTEEVLVDGPDIIIGIHPNSYPMLRMLARVDVRLKNDIANFVLEEVRLYNRKTAGFVSYEFSNFLDMSPAAGSRVQQAAVPLTNSNYTGAGNEGVAGNSGKPYLKPTVTYLSTGTDTYGHNEFIRSIYTYESPSYTDDDRLKGTALVVGGKYNGSSATTYYRINLKTNDDFSANASSHILRNHLYDVEIQRVNGSGAKTPDEAYEGVSQITVKILCWSEQNINSPIYGIYNLIVDKSVVSMPRSGGSEKLYVFTDFANSADYPDGWTLDLTGMPSWITSVTPVSGAAGVTTEVIVTVAANTSGVSRTGTFHIKAGNITKTITVTQLVPRMIN